MPIWKQILFPLLFPVGFWFGIWLGRKQGRLMALRDRLLADMKKMTEISENLLKNNPGPMIVQLPPGMKPPASGSLFFDHKPTQEEIYAAVEALNKKTDEFIKPFEPMANELRNGPIVDPAVDEEFAKSEINRLLNNLNEKENKL